MTALAKTKQHDIDLSGGFSRSQIDLIKKTVAVGVSDDELKLFLIVCKQTGLDPFSRQIYAIRRRTGDEEKMVIQTGIDGYRSIAARTGLYCGNDDVVYTEGENGYPKTATVTVWKNVGGQRCAFTATARWAEYAPFLWSKKTSKQELSPFWKRSPFLMLGKCAEALALRKAFPLELSGLRTEEEMHQADVPIEATESKTTPEQHLSNMLSALHAGKIPLEKIEKRWKDLCKVGIPEPVAKDGTAAIELCKAIPGASMETIMEHKSTCDALLDEGMISQASYELMVGKLNDAIKDLEARA